jgi:pSer/pThr/pTyr-binding forkhead associated (FHA) protein
MAKLVHSQAGRVIGEYPLGTGCLRIGRGKENDIRLEDLTVSGSHAVVEVQPSEYLEGCNDIYIVDQQSTNGTVVNGRHIKRHLLKHGDVAVIGQNEFGLIDEEALSFERTMVYLPENKN